MSGDRTACASGSGCRFRGSRAEPGDGDPDERRLPTGQFKAGPRTTGPRLAGRRILVLEDEPLIALDIAQTVEEAAGRVVGPALTVGDALALIERNPVDAAILDFALADGDARPVIERLRGSETPFILHTGARVLPGVHPAGPCATVFLKPVASLRLAESLEAMLGGAAA